MGLLETAGKAAVASAVHGRVQRRQQMRWARQDAEAARRGVDPPDPLGLDKLKTAWAGTSPSPSPDPGGRAEVPRGSVGDIQEQLALIGQLNDLRSAGALTDAEFEAKKAQILQL